MNKHHTICVLCYASFEATTSYGLCPTCWSKDKLREWDRLQSAYKTAKRAGVLASLELTEWLTILSDFKGRCAYCLVQWSSHIERVDGQKGLEKGNIVPICRGCQEIKRSSWESAVSRVHAYLTGETQLWDISDLEQELEEGVM